MKNIFRITTLSLLLSLTCSAATETTAKATFSDIKDYNYVCMHASQPIALVFKTSNPQKIWRTTLTNEGQLKTRKAFQLSNINMNAENVNTPGKVASFKAQLAKNYEIKGLFQKDFDGELPLTVISTYLPTGKESQITARYNCENMNETQQLKLGAITKE